MAAASQVEIDLYHYSKIERGVKSPGRTLSVRFRDQAGIDPGDWDLFSERTGAARVRG